MTTEMITVQGGKDYGDIRRIDGQWYIRIDTFYVDGYEMEEAYDANMESGWYSNVKLAETDEEKAFVASYLAEKERKEQERRDKQYRINNTALFIPKVGQRVFYRMMKANPKHATIVEMGGKMGHMVRVKKDGENKLSWIEAFYLDLLDGSTDGTFYDLNEVSNEQ